MAATQETQLTMRQIVRLTAAIPADNMAVIAEKCLHFSVDTIDFERKSNINDEEEFDFKRKIISIWMDRNKGENQPKVILMIPSSWKGRNKGVIFFKIKTKTTQRYN